MKTLLLFTLLLSFFAACQDRNNVIVKGRITDSKTGQAIPRAEVVVLCWFEATLTENSYENQSVLSDEKGEFRVNFTKGHKIQLASKAIGYSPTRKFSELKGNQIQVNLELTKVNNNPTLISYLHTNYSRNDVPFLKVRIYYLENTSRLNFDSMETFGFDFFSRKITKDTANCDVWFRPVLKDDQPFILVANKGGILPVYSNEVKSSFYYDKPIAPMNGYVKEYQFQGNEDGFFVLCRDGKTFGKIIFEKSTISKGDIEGKYVDRGKHFSSLYQPNGTTDLSYPDPNIDLEKFLTDGRLR